MFEFVSWCQHSRRHWSSTNNFQSDKDELTLPPLSVYGDYTITSQYAPPTAFKYFLVSYDPTRLGKKWTCYMLVFVIESQSNHNFYHFIVAESQFESLLYSMWKQYKEETMRTHNLIVWSSEPESVKGHPGEPKKLWCNKWALSSVKYDIYSGIDDISCCWLPLCLYVVW